MLKSRNFVLWANISSLHLNSLKFKFVPSSKPRIVIAHKATVKTSVTSIFLSKRSIAAYTSIYEYDEGCHPKSIGVISREIILSTISHQSATFHLLGENKKARHLAASANSGQ